MDTQASYKKCVSAALVALAAAGCAPVHTDLTQYQQKPKRVQVHQVEFAHDVLFVAGSARLAEGEARRLDAFLARNKPGPDGHVTLAFPGGPKSGKPLMEVRRGVISKSLAGRGFLVGKITTTGGDGTPDADHVRLVLSRYVVTLPPCPDWTKPVGATFDNRVHSNFGCADAVNLGLMVARPADLMEGRDPGPADAEQAVTSIQRYRAGQTKSLEGQSTAAPGQGPTQVQEAK